MKKLILVLLLVIVCGGFQYISAQSFQRATNFKDQIMENAYKTKKSRTRKAIRRIRRTGRARSAGSAIYVNNYSHKKNMLYKVGSDNSAYNSYIKSIGYKVNKDNQYLPTSALTLASVAHTYICNYQNYNSDIGYPSSFLINAASLKTYLDSLDVVASGGNYYLQIYLAYSPNANNQLTLVLDGVMVNDSGLRVHYYQDANLPTVYGNAIPCPACGVVIDNLDGPENMNLQWNTNINIPDCTLPLDIAKDWIANYQTWTTDNTIDDPNENDTSYSGYPQSMLIYANELKNFLDTNNVPYLQIYLAYKNNNTDLTFVFVGVDSLGNHVYAHDALQNNYVFEECDPCPKCNIAPDQIDQYPQFIR